MPREPWGYQLPSHHGAGPKRSRATRSDPAGPGGMGVSRDHQRLGKGSSLGGQCTRDLCVLPSPRPCKQHRSVTSPEAEGPPWEKPARPLARGTGVRHLLGLGSGFDGARGRY